MPFETIVCEKKDRVGIVTLNRLEKINAINPQMTLELGDAVADMDSDDDVRVPVLKGAGRGFCAGADVGGAPRAPRKSIGYKL